MDIKKNADFIGWSESDKQLRKKEITLFEHLLLNPNFIKEVEIFRKRHDIQSGGFKTDKGYIRWWENYKPPHQKVGVIEERITLDGDDKPKTKQREIIQEVGTYHLDLCKILRKFNLSLEWYSYVNSYICRNSQVKLNPHEIDLVRHTCQGLIIQEEIRFKFGATMNVEYLTKKFMGQSIWANAVEPLQQLMQGYQEKGQRPEKSQTKLQARIYKRFSNLPPPKKGKDKESFGRDAFISGMIGMPSNPDVIRKHISRFRKKIKPNN